MIDDPEAMDDEERAQAQALARALEGHGDSPDLPQDALEAAALLRYSGQEGELEDGRGEAILSELLQGAKPPRRHPAAGSSRSTPRMRWLPLWLGAAVAVAAALLLLGRPPDSAEPTTTASGTPRSTLPPPPARLLQAQAKAGRGQAGAERLDAEMRRYREAVFRALEASYPAPLGMATPRPPDGSSRGQELGP